MISRIERIFISLEPIDEEFGGPCPPCGSGPSPTPPPFPRPIVSATVSLHAPRDVRSSRAPTVYARGRRGGGEEGEERRRRRRRRRPPREAISSIYRQRLHGSFAEAPPPSPPPPPIPPNWSPTRRAFRVCGRMPARARGYIRRQTLRRCAGSPSPHPPSPFSLSPPPLLLIPRPGSLCRRRCTAFRASSIRRHRRRAVAPLNRTKSRTANEPFAARARVLVPFARFRSIGRGARRSQSAESSAWKV